MKTDWELQRGVQYELQRDPRVDACGVGVNVHNGVVTLLGTVSHYGERRVVAEIATRIEGVIAIANELEVSSAPGGARCDTDIAEAAAATLRSQPEVPANKVKAMVNHGWITLTGELRTQNQRAIAEAAVRKLSHVRGVVNSTTLESARPVAGQEQIEEATRLGAALQAQQIVVEFTDGEISLRGSVQSDQQRNDAALMAWTVPGVSKAENLLVVQPSARDAY